MRRRSANPNAPHSQSTAAATSGYTSTGMTVASGIDRLCIMGGCGKTGRGKDMAAPGDRPKAAAAETNEHRAAVREADFVLLLPRIHSPGHHRLPSVASVQLRRLHRRRGFHRRGADGELGFVGRLGADRHLELVDAGAGEVRPTRVNTWLAVENSPGGT